MLDDWITQGLGLHRIAAPTTLRIITVASHGDKASELQLLWGLCSTWSSLGYSMTVLDATESESPSQPGFEQLIDGVYWEQPTDSGGAWPILAAARGLVRLRQRALRDEFPLHLVPNFFPQNDILVIYAETDTLVSFFPDSGMEPLLALSSQNNALVTAYLSVKHLLLNARLRPMIASLADSSRTGPDAAQLTKKLQDCTSAFLGQKVPAMLVNANPDTVRTDPHMERLALLLLENAVPLDRGMHTVVPQSMLNRQPGHFARSHH